MRGKVAVLPLGMVWVEDMLLMENDTPWPVRGTVCGLPAALSSIDSVPCEGVPPVGLNWTLIWQLVPEASEAGQLLVWRNGGLPAMLLIVMPNGPELLTVTV